MLRRISLIFAGTMLLFASSAQLPVVSASENPIGSWLGTLNAGTIELRMVFNIEPGDNGMLKGTMDSPDQGVKGIVMGEVLMRNDSLIIDAPLVRGGYRGVMTSDSTISGLWTQMGQSFRIDLKRQYETFVLNRPQEPLPPYPYREEEVVFKNNDAGIMLAGTITRPDDEGVYPAVILVSGSGQQNRDEEIFGHKPFRVLADYLTRRGIVVLRYDDRGVGGSEGDPSGATSADFATDAMAAFSYLESMPYVNSKQTGVIGHSEGGLIALMLAAGNSDVDFIVTLAGPGTTGREILLDQSEIISRLSGIPEITISLNNRLNSTIYDIMEDEPESGAAMEKIRREAGEILAEQGVAAEQTESIISGLESSLGGSSYNWLRYFIMSDPAHYLERITCPVLALNGEKDCQVPGERNLKAISSGLEKGGNSEVATMLLPDLNHLFQTSGTGLPAEYGVIEETINKDVLIIIGDWITGAVSK
jgi:pimeloyl-ACP methyl ester carboxylesterase